MRNLKFLHTMTTFVISCLLVACNTTTDPTPTEEPILYKGATLYDKYSPFLAGDTIITTKKATLHTAPKATNVKNLQKNEQTPLRYVAIGGSLSAGVRDFGLYRAGQETAFPNLLAIQMGITDFKQPLFSETDYNGYGYRTLTTRFRLPGSILPMYNTVKNNLALIEYISPYNFTLTPFKGEFNNLAVPFTTQANLSYQLKIGTDGFFKRFEIIGDKNLQSYLNNKDFDFISIEGDIHRVLSATLNNSVPNYSDPFSDQPNIAYLKVMKAKNIKAIYLNMPSVLDFSYFNIYKYEKIREVTKGKRIYISDGSGGSDPVGGGYFFPNGNIDTLANTLISDNLKRGLSKEIPLRIGSVLDENKVEPINTFITSNNSYYLKQSKELGFAYVDLNTLYKKIIAGGYVTDDGVRVDATFIKGNFFSNDGLYPTAFGQAVITNEIIRTLNTTFKTDIPFIKTAEYLKK